MAHLHLQLLAARFNDLADGYLRRVAWITEPTVASVQSLQRSIDAIGGLQCFRNQRVGVFGDVELGKEILHFDRPILCCKRILRCSETLIAHLLSDSHADSLEDETKRTAIMFNLYVQAVNSVLVRYFNNYEKVDEFTVDYLRKGQDYLSCILRKPIRRDTSAAGTFIRTNFSKWKYVFDYTCDPCCKEGFKRCRFPGSIAWFKIHAKSLAVNPIRHLGSQMHAEAIRKMLPDQDISSKEEINNNQDWQHPKAAAYLNHVREVDLQKLVDTGLKLARETPFKAISTFLNNHLSLPLGGIRIDTFGSRVMGIAEPGSDVDIHITSLAGLAEERAFFLTLTWAKNCRDLEFIGMIPAAPWLVRAYLEPLDLELDITFGSAYVIDNAKLVKYFFGLQPHARKMYFLLKKWKQQAELSQNFHSNVLVMLLTFYMQRRKYLPSIRSILNGPQKLNNDAFNTNFNTNYRASVFPDHLLMLARGFFEYYAAFDWTRNGICAFDGEVKSKQSFKIRGDRKSVPPMMCSDFFDQGRNVACNIANPDYAKFITACAEAKEILDDRHNLR